MKIKSPLFASLCSAMLALSLLSACGSGNNSPTAASAVAASDVKVFERTNAPDKLSSWNLLQSDGKLMKLNPATVAYDLNSTLFSDYASKLRAIYIPKGSKIAYNGNGADPFDFPNGSVIVKTFYYPKATANDASYIGAQAVSHQTVQGDSIDLSKNHLIETRLLVKQADGSWLGLPYVWDEDQKDASLKIGGDVKQVELVAGDASHQKISYKVPSAQQCQQCHAITSAGGGALLPIGPKAHNLNKTYAYSAGVKNQLDNLNDLGMLSGYISAATTPKAADWTDTTQTLDARAKGYLEANCAHCHSTSGQAQQSGLLLGFNQTANPLIDSVKRGICKKPLAYGGPGLPYQYDIVPGSPETSILLYRTSHTDSEAVMPVIGRSSTHVEANAMLSEWITTMAKAECSPP
ncbi:SO2930 family diheme c-type cytochrome [Undibacterium sp. Ren11W]|uniref:SO2930 family diheme c-type cytochrome n=1 Tax=Undibacterium sp. Ren11W TaxID=3413045 RepID=UPI003BEFF318